MTDASWAPPWRARPAVARHPRALLAAAAVTVAVAPLTAMDEDALGGLVAGVPWAAIGTVAVLVVLCATHFLSAAYGVRAVAGRRLPLGPTMFAQVAAAATNRLVPNGIGGAGLNLRYLLRAGVSGGAATSGLGALAVVAGLTDAGYVTLVTTLGPSVGLRGGSQEFSALAAGGAHSGQSRWILLIAAAVMILVLLRRGRRVAWRRLAAGVGDALRHARDLCLAPARLCAAAAASMASTVVMSFGFVLAVHVWGSGRAHLPAGALVAIYLVATALGGTAPLPSFFAVTELALIGALVVGGYSAPSAVVTVVVFRAVTYWLPLPIGLWTARRLRRAQLL